MCQFVPQQEYKTLDFKDLDKTLLSSSPLPSDLLLTFYWE